MKNSLGTVLILIGSFVLINYYSGSYATSANAATGNAASEFETAEIIVYPDPQEAPDSTAGPGMLAEPGAPPGAGLELRSGIVFLNEADLNPTTAAINVKAREQEKRLGFTRIKDDGHVSELDMARDDHDDPVSPLRERRLKDMNNVAAALEFSPARIDGTLLARAKLVGGTPNGSNNGAGWNTLDRIFDTPEFGLVRLIEDDYIDGGGTVLFVREDINRDINGTPAQFKVRCKTTARCESELRWATSKMSYTLTSNRALTVTKLIESFINIARGLR